MERGSNGFCYSGSSPRSLPTVRLVENYFSTFFLVLFGPSITIVVGMMVPEFRVTAPETVLTEDVSTKERISSHPLLEDHYEVQDGLILTLIRLSSDN